MLMQAASMFVLAFALSLDSFGVGMTYGLRRVRIPIFSIVIISICSGLFIWLSMQAGGLLVRYVSPAAAQWTGSVILITIGAWAIIQLLRKKEDATEAGRSRSDGMKQIPPQDLKEWIGRAESKPLIRIQLRRLGLVIQILKTPSAADIDRSGSISAAEAAWLGAALSLDAFGAGIGASLLGYPSLLTALVIALFSGAFLRAGMHLGMKFSHQRWIKKISFLPGLLLMLMGMLKLIS
ncbi:MntP/YtaF family protein [Paenibacillus thiaminolyticus]|uniref:MntP/YtaF family protein n=1 Tax=Paenibacillus thiaminolyticus TaxID=49283 RepID=UPI002542BF89|nr:MntP/YtaF family protein [Paenibacillus thiaminolyticus]WII36161.1 MntP/YtaF family protein [Paenibacillus thiaminolyticus]